MKKIPGFNKNGIGTDFLSSLRNVLIALVKDFLLRSILQARQATIGTTFFKCIVKPMFEIIGSSQIISRVPALLQRGQVYPIPIAVILTGLLPIVVIIVKTGCYPIKSNLFSNILPITGIGFSCSPAALIIPKIMKIRKM